MIFIFIFECLYGGFIVFCQVYFGEVMCDLCIMVQVVDVVIVGGVVGICVQGIDDICVVVVFLVLIIGLWKDGDVDVFIMLMLEYVVVVVDVGVDIVVIDGICCWWFDGWIFVEIIVGLCVYFDVFIMVDCGLFDDVIVVEVVGVDIFGMILFGYIGECLKSDGFDFEFIGFIVVCCVCLVVVEGCFYILVYVVVVIVVGVYVVCVGMVIIYLVIIMLWFVWSFVEVCL